MLMVDDMLVSDDVVKEHFACNLKSCKGACCWEGDFGAPLEFDELDILDSIKDKVAPYLSDEPNEMIRQKGTSTFFEGMDDFGTSLMPNGACVFMTKNELGIAGCGIEQAYKDGVIDFYKPISCHLYPVRVLKNKGGFDYALNYDRWSICSNSCDQIGADKIQLYKFVKAALIRKFGEGFYEQLEYLDGLASTKEISLDDIGDELE